MQSIFINGVEYRAFDNLYLVSRDGDALRGTVKATMSRMASGYITVGRQRLLHRMVAICWLENPTNAAIVHHINGDKADNRADNLEWVVSHSKHIKEHHNKITTYVRTKEHREKLRQMRLGTKQSEETKQKKREAALRNGSRPPAREPGSKMSPESIQRCRVNNANNRACMVDGVIYPSFGEAGRALGIRSLTLRKRCLSPNFPNYQVLE